MSNACVQLGDTEVVSPAAPDLTDDLTDAELAADLAADAGKLLLQVRAEIGFDQPWTLGEAGDRQANSLLLRRLQAERPGDAVLSEEAHDDLARLKSDRVWIIDPLDGTREFSTPGRDDWAVHIALWRRSSNGQPEITDAAVALPARGNVVYRTDTVTSGAAPAGVMLAAGMHASRLDGSPLRYNQLDPYLPDLLMCRAEVAPILLGAIADAWR